MLAVTATVERFDPASIAELDEPVRRYLTHAIANGAALARGTRVRMRGRIKVGPWLSFTGGWEGDGRSFVWRARSGWGRLTPLHVVDRYDRDATASMDVRLLGAIPLVRADDEDTVRSAAGRTAVEAASWAPMSLLPQRGVSWRAASDEEIVAAWDVPPERPEVHLGIDVEGALRSCWVPRWDGGQHGKPGYVPCGGEIHAERRFGDLTIPSEMTIGWWFGTKRFEPFFEAEILAVEPMA